MIVTNNDKYAKEISNTVKECRQIDIKDSLLIFLKLFFYFIFKHPLLYFIPENLPFLRLSETIYSTGFEIRRFTSTQSILGISMLKKLNKINTDRRNKGLFFYKKLRHLKNINLIRNGNDDALYLRFPIFVDDEEKRNKIYEELNNLGLGISKMYPESLNRIKPLFTNLNRLKKYSNAERISKQILTLPTHYAVTYRDIDCIIKVIEKYLTGEQRYEN